MHVLVVCLIVSFTRYSVDSFQLHSLTVGGTASFLFYFILRLEVASIKANVATAVQSLTLYQEEALFSFVLSTKIFL